jgi:hypothetical protein
MLIPITLLDRGLYLFAGRTDDRPRVFQRAVGYGRKDR